MRQLRDAVPIAMVFVIVAASAILLFETFVASKPLVVPAPEPIGASTPPQDVAASRPDDRPH